MTILMFRCRAANIMHRLAYCTSCRGTISYQSVPYGTEWSDLQKLNWVQECDEHRALCDQWIEEHRKTIEAHRDAPKPAAQAKLAGPISPQEQGVVSPPNIRPPAPNPARSSPLRSSADDAEGLPPSLPTDSPSSASGAGTTPDGCACGREAVAMQFQMGPNKGQVWCTRCGRRVA